MEHQTRRLSIDSAYLDGLTIGSNSIHGSKDPIVSSNDNTDAENTNTDQVDANANNTSNNIYKTSKRRWAVLFAVSIFGLTSSLVDTEGPILHTMLELLELPLQKFVYIGLIFSYVPIITTVPTAWLIDRFGIRAALYGATLLMLVRNGSKALLFNPNLPHWKSFKLIYWIITSMTGMQILTTFFCTPLKISETWFSIEERSIAWTVIMSSTNIGASIASFAYPRIIHHVKDVTPLFYLNISCAIITAVAVFTCVTQSKPKHPPSERTLKSSNKEDVSYFKTIKRISLHKDMMIHLLHEAFFDGVYYAVMSVYQDILISSCHSKIFIGNLMSINSIISLIMLIGLSSFVHRIKNIVLICKIGSFFRLILFIVFLISLLFPIDDWIVLLTSISYSICKSWSLPNFNNMTAFLASGNVSEATASSFQVTLTIATVTINQIAFMSLVKINPQTGKSDYTDSIIFSSIGAIACSAMYLIFFHGKVAKHVRLSEEAPQSVTSVTS